MHNNALNLQTVITPEETALAHERNHFPTIAAHARLNHNAERPKTSSSSLVLHCGGSGATFEQVAAIPVPEHTSTWRPMPYADMIGYVKAIIDQKIGAPIKSEAYGLNKAGDQMFGLITLDVGDRETGLSIGLRSSYNKSIAPALACGSKVFVCDNLCFSGDAFQIVRKNTKNVWTDFRNLVTGHVAKALGHYDAMKTSAARMAEIPCNLRRGHAILGVALGERVITPTQATVAYGDWATARHEDFADRNLWSLYNCVTEGLKKGSPARTLDRHTLAHAFFSEIQGLS